MSKLLWDGIEQLYDIDESLDCGVDVAISISTSDIHIKHKLKKDREWVYKAWLRQHNIKIQIVCIG